MAGRMVLSMRPTAVSKFYLFWMVDGVLAVRPLVDK